MVTHGSVRSGRWGGERKRAKKKKCAFTFSLKVEKNRKQKGEKENKGEKEEEVKEGGRGKRRGKGMETERERQDPKTQGPPSPFTREARHAPADMQGLLERIELLGNEKVVSCLESCFHRKRTDVGGEMNTSFCQQDLGRDN